MKKIQLLAVIAENPNLLTPREVIVLKQQFAITDEELSPPLEPVYGISPERVRQIEAKALEKIRRHLNSPRC